MKLIDFTNNKSSKIIILVMIAVLAVFLIEYRKKQGSPIQTQLTRLPEFDAIDVNGQAVSSKALRGKLVYIQFINPVFEPDLVLLEEVYNRWKSSALHFIVVTNHSDQLNFKHHLNNANVIEKDFDILCRKFRISMETGYHFVIDKQGNIVNSEKNYIGYEKGPKIALKEIIDNDTFSISSFIKEDKYIHDYEWFSQIDRIIKKEKENKYFVISLFTKICDSCSGGGIIRALSTIEQKKEQPPYILCVLNKGKFRERDIPAMESQLKINFDIAIADNTLDKKWDSLINQYREDYLTDVVFLLDDSGKILKIADRSCDCYSSFFSFVNSL